MPMNYKEIHPKIRRYMDMVEQGQIRACKEQHSLIALVKKILMTEDVYINKEQFDKYLSQVKYFDYDEIFAWEQFVLGLHCCTYKKSDNRPRWPDLFMLIGRGAGKDGYIAYESWCLAGPYNGIKKYDVDICANSEDQAKAPFDDIHDVLEEPVQTKKLELHWYWTKEEIISRSTKSRIKYRTNNPKGKDGLRSGIVVFNEIHQYQDYKNINVFTTGLGKKPHPRRTYATTNGDVRDGPLDHMLEDAISILNEDQPDNGMLPFICRLDSKDEVHDPQNWQKSNPSLPYRPDLMAEIEKEYRDWIKSPNQFTAFMTKRMNIPDGNPEVEVASWENIIATNKPVIDLRGNNAVVGIDYSKLSDMASVNLHFKIGDVRYDINHAWLCLKSPDLPRIKAPWQQWANEGFITLVTGVEIHPDLITEYIEAQMHKYNIVKLALDNFRYALLSKSLERIGFDSTIRKNIKLVRPSDIMKVSPVIDSVFINQQFVWGDQPVLRWATNNSKQIKVGKEQGQDIGNYIYGKIEGRSRKTDPFMAMVHSMTIEQDMPEVQTTLLDLDVRTY